jgi:hypothetical protein
MFRFVPLLFLFVITICHSGSQKTTVVVVRPEQVTIQTDQTKYIAKYHETVHGQDRYKFLLVARFENRTGATIYLERCYPDTPYPIYDVVSDNGSGVQGSDGYGTAQGCVGHDSPIIVEPGETRVDKLVIYGPNAWTSESLVTKEALAGRFRLTYRTHFCRELYKCERPDVAQYSNAFTVGLQN